MFKCRTKVRITVIITLQIVCRSHGTQISRPDVASGRYYVVSLAFVVRNFEIIFAAVGQRQDTYVLSKQLFCYSSEKPGNRSCKGTFKADKITNSIVFTHNLHPAYTTAKIISFRRDVAAAITEEWYFEQNNLKKLTFKTFSIFVRRIYIVRNA